MEQNNSITSRVRVMVLRLALFSLFVIAPAAFLSGGSKSNAAEQKGGIGVTPSSTANPIVGKARLAEAVQEKEPSGMIGGRSYKNDVSPPLRNMKQLPIVQSPEHEAAENPKIPRNHVDSPDPVVQNFLAPDLMPAPILNFDGIPFPGAACNCAPPDTDGEVGLTQYVQMVNEGYQVFNKATGASVLGPSGISTIWAGFGGFCQNNGHGDPIVLYDQIAGRWLISQFAGAGNKPTDECIAVSTSSDATGSYNRYGFHLGSNFFDYPKIGVWLDGYYMSDNVFNAGTSAFLGVQAFAFDRTAMLAGSAATFLTSGLIGSPATNEDPLLPGDIDGSTLPAAGTPCPFVEFPDSAGNNGNTYSTWLFHADFVTPGNSTFIHRTSPAAAGFTFLCPVTRPCVPQPEGTDLDGIGDRLMHRLPYRIIGGVERVVGNFNVSSGGVAGIRWFELRNVTSGSETVFQESTYQPDTTWRWMGSIAQDHLGNMALGFSASSTTIFPSVRYAGRLISDPAGTLGQGETNMFTGLGSQGGGTASRWGDYSAMSIDPVDDCTFWYTQEYNPPGVTTFNWRTRIGNFKFPTCGGGVTTPVITSAGATITGESCTPANGVLDPNETVTVSFCVQNVGSGPTTSLVGTLQNTGGVSGASGPQNYGALPAGGAAVCRNFTFIASGTCGGTVTATIHFVDGAADLGNVPYTFTLGVSSEGGFTCANCSVPICTGIICPANITKPNDTNQCGAIVTYPAPTPAGSGCGTITCSPASGSFFSKGTTTVSCNATAGASCSFTVTVNDTQPPTITCPAPIFVAAAATCPPASGRTVDYTVTALDNCPGVTVVCNPPSGSIFPVGTTSVTCTATDASGNTATCNFAVTVVGACLVDESNPGNVVLFNIQTGEYRFCCNGALQATGRGILTIRGCQGSITDRKGDRKVTIGFDFAAGKGTAALFVGGSASPKCTITDQSMANNTCICPTGVPTAVVK